MLAGSYAALSNLVYRGSGAHPSVTGPMKTTIQVWRCSRAAGLKPSCISPHTPLWGNPLLPHLYKIPNPAVWATRGIITLRQVMPRGAIAFQELGRTHRLPGCFQFRYWQLRHALRA